MTPEPSDRPTDEQLADLARLADGTLPDERRAELESQVAASPELARALRSQALTLDALRRTAATTGAPARLRSSVERRSAKRPRRKFAPIRGAVAAGMAAVLAIVLVLPGIFSSGLTVADAAAYGGKPPTAPPPRTVTGTPQLLREQVDGVPFPNYAAKFGWKAVGVRHDRSSGHDVTTVYYRKGSRTVAYAIVSGDALGRPNDAHAATHGNVEYRSLRADGRAVVTWRRSGHTCVMSATAVSARELVTLADWRGKGKVPF